MFEREIRRKYEKDLLLRDIDIVDRFDRYKIYITYVYKTSYPAITSKNKKKNKEKRKKEKKNIHENKRRTGKLSPSFLLFLYTQFYDCAYLRNLRFFCDPPYISYIYLESMIIRGEYKRNRHISMVVKKQRRK